MGMRKILSDIRKKKLPLKKAYYLSFLFLIVLPLLIVLVVLLLMLNRQFKRQAIENIRQAQETVLTELKSDMDVMSMRLAQLINTNNNEVLAYAAETDTADYNVRYQYEQKLQQSGNLLLEPIKDIISVSFYMKDGRKTYIKNEIFRSTDEIREKDWYQNALEHRNAVCIGSYDTEKMNDLYQGGKKDLLILVFALAPDVTTDRSQKIEMVVFYQSTDAADRIKEYNRNYLLGRNKFGIARIRDESGEVIFATTEEEGLDLTDRKYTCITTPFTWNDTCWYLENYIETKDLTKEYWDQAILVLAAAALILVLAAYYSGYFLTSIVKPIGEISAGLKQVEEGNLDVHINASGQSEVKDMIHQFNAMVRRLRALIGEYEEKMKSAELRPEDYFGEMLKGEIMPEEVNRRTREFFSEKYAILGFYIENTGQAENMADALAKMKSCFEKNPRFASRCVSCPENENYMLLSFYRITEEEYESRIYRMIQELQGAALKEYGISFAACIGHAGFGPEEFMERTEEIRKKICLRHIYGEKAVIDLNREEGTDELLQLSERYEKLAGALYIADEKNMAEEKEKLFGELSAGKIQDARRLALAAILAAGKRFSIDNSDFGDVFGQKYNYRDKIDRVEDVRNLKLWLTNYFAWIMDYSASRLQVSETDVVIRAKRYMADHYEDANLSLSDVAEYVGLNEKYFTNRFTKETGETFSSYLTSLRMQKAKELLKTTTFKVYEISEMVGYHNVEHFNRVFKKLNGVTPAGYRKTM